MQALLRTVLALLVTGATAWSQSPSEAPPIAKDASSTAKVDHADAYYHYGLARVYAERAASSVSHNREYLKLAIENYRAAIKADPQVFMLTDELADLQAGRYTLFLWPLYPFPATP
jgi:hypothetical protein